MNRAKRLYILLGVLAAACIAAFAVLHLEQRQEEIAESGETVLEIDPDAVQSLSWEYEGEPLAFHRDGDGWLYDDDEAFPVDGEKIQELLGQFEAFGAAFVITDVEDYAQYGLDDPELTIWLHQAAGHGGGELSHRAGQLQQHGRAAVCLHRGRQRVPGVQRPPGRV